MDRAEAVTTIVQKLGEVEREPLKKLKAVVRILGPDKALALCEKALEVEQQGGMMTRYGTRRRTQGSAGDRSSVAVRACRSRRCTVRRSVRAVPV